MQLGLGANVLHDSKGLIFSLWHLKNSKTFFVVSLLEPLAVARIAWEASSYSNLFYQIESKFKEH